MPKGASKRFFLRGKKGCLRPEKERNKPVGVIQREGFDFAFDPSACMDCPSRCCGGTSGHVWVNQQELLEICTFLSTNPIDCIQKYFNRVENRLSIKERFSGHDFECVFLEGLEKRCSIYEARPLQCRRFPFWDHFRTHKDEVIEECPGIRVTRGIL